MQRAGEHLVTAGPLAHAGSPGRSAPRVPVRARRRASRSRTGARRRGAAAELAACVRPTTGWIHLGTRSSGTDRARCFPIRWRRGSASSSSCPSRPRGRRAPTGSPSTSSRSTASGSRRSARARSRSTSTSPRASPFARSRCRCMVVRIPRRLLPSQRRTRLSSRAAVSPSPTSSRERCRRRSGPASSSTLTRRAGRRSEPPWLNRARADARPVARRRRAEPALRRARPPALAPRRDRAVHAPGAAGLRRGRPPFRRQARGQTSAAIRSSADLNTRAPSASATTVSTTR